MECKIEKGFQWMGLAEDGRLLKPQNNWGGRCYYLGTPLKTREDAIASLNSFLEIEEPSPDGPESYVLVEVFTPCYSWV